MSGNQSSSMPFIQNLSNLCQNLVDIGISTCEQGWIWYSKKTIYMYNNILISIQLHHPFAHS